MKVQEITILGSEYLLPHVPLISDNVDDESIWKECGLVFLLEGKSEDASLDSDDDNGFYLAVLDIAMT